MLVLLCLLWGINWPVVRVALGEIPPFTMRIYSVGLGAATLALICLLKRRSFRVPRGRARVHLVVAALLNVAGFVMVTTFAQLATATGRVSILAYTMPIWSVLLAWLFLKERPVGIQWLALALCAIGLAILIYPLTAAGVPVGALLAVASGMLWGAGTVYLKWARIEADPMGVASWQIIIAFLAIAICGLLYQGGLDLGHPSHTALFNMIFAGIFGNGVAYGLWFAIVRRLPAVTASLGVVSVPAVGVIASLIILGEVPTVTDIVGFVLIFAASACVLLARPAPVAATP